MIDKITLNEAVNIILDRILTPVLYMYEDEALEFICFADVNTPEEDFHDAEKVLFQALGINAEIIDIRSFDETDRVEITENAELLYSENDMVKLLFEAAMSADKERSMNFKRDVLKRRGETGTYYIN